MADSDLPLEARLVRDLIAWIEREGHAPMLVAAREGVEGSMPGVPPDARQVVLNVSSRAVRNLEFGPEAMTFGAGFGRVRSTLSVSYGAVMQITAAEEGVFVGAVLRTEAEPAPAPEPTEGNDQGPSDPEAARRRFRVVRDDES
jgi:stringent starvation protein B